ncbi:MAG: ATP cone domain-containing protein [Patescibacteria group bacterium]|nr:ATP cone domain-containing protein [Patescibacteria group bacterium]
MANTVIKKDGTKKPFDSEKIRKSIESAAEEAGLEKERISEIVNQVANETMQLAEGKEEIATSELKEKILSTLDTVEPSVSAAWREYDSKRKAQ